MHSERNHGALRAFASFLILVLAFAILLIFNNNQTNILDNGQFHLYIILATIGAALLLALLYFVNKPQPKAVKAAKKTAKKSSKKAKRK